MKDAVTIVGVRFSRQQDQSPVHVGQDLRLKASPDFLQRRCTCLLLTQSGHRKGMTPVGAGVRFLR